MTGCLPEQLENGPVRAISPVIAVRYPEMLKPNASLESLRQQIADASLLTQDVGLFLVFGRESGK
jgi:hypothetical protein